MKMTKMMKRILACAAVMAMIFSLTACGGSQAQTAAEPAAAEEQKEAETPADAAEPETKPEETAQEPGENPILKYEGAYSDENGSGIYVLFEAADDTDGVNISIGYPEEAAYTYWEITGKIKDNVVTYENGHKFSMDWGTPDQEEVTEEEVYTDGTGSFEISEDAKITWTDNKEDIAKGMVFVWDEEMNAMIAEQMEGTEFNYSDSQNPSMNWAGPYTDTTRKDRTMLVYSGSEEGTDCMVTITDSPTPETMIDWMMTGEFDLETMSITYTECVKTEYALDADGNITSENKIYEDGTGRFVIDDESQTITWIDDKEDAGKGSVFAFQYDYGEIGGEAWTGEPAAEAP